MSAIGKHIIRPIGKFLSKVGGKVWGATKSVGGFIGRGLAKGFGAVKSGFGKIAGLLSIGSTLLNFNKQNEKDNNESIKSISQAGDEASKSSNSVKADTNKLKKKNVKPQADPDALQDKRAADAERAASNEKVERIKTDVRKMDELSERAVSILRKYGSQAASKMGPATNYSPSASMMAGKASENVLLGEQIRLMYDQKINHNKNIYNILGMLGANNDLLGILTEQARLIHRQGLNDANYGAMKAEIMGRLADKAILESKSANLTLSDGNVMEELMGELVASQKQGNETQTKSSNPLLKKVGIGILGGLAGLAGMILASKVGAPSVDKRDSGDGNDKQGAPDDGGMEADKPSEWEDDADNPGISDAEPEYTDEEKLEQVKKEGIANATISTAANGYEAIKRLKTAHQAAAGAKAAVAGAGATAKVAGAAARKKFINSLGPRALKVIGAKIGAKLALKAATKSALKKIPVLGLGFSLFEAIPRLWKGDYTGAALALGSGAASCLHLADAFSGPAGSIAALGLGALADGALAMHDYNQAMEDLKTKGHSDLIDDDDLADVLVTPTEEEMKAAEDAEKKVQEEQSAKDKLAANSNAGGDPSMSPDDMSPTTVGLPAAATTPSTDAKEAAESLKSLGKNGVVAGADPQASEYSELLKAPVGNSASTPRPKEKEDGALMKGLKSVGSFLWDLSPVGIVQQAMGVFSTPGGRSEVEHGTSGNWVGFGANADSSESDVGTMDVSPEALDRIQNFGNYNVNELDEGGRYANDTNRMINDVTSMQGRIVYSQENRNIDNNIGDCSAFAKWALKKYYGVDVGGYSEAQLLESAGRVVDYSGINASGAGKGRQPNLAALKPGDLIFYSSNRWKGRRAFGTGHVEVYLGNGKTIGMNTFKDGKRQTNDNGDPIGPWVHDINDPLLGNYIAAKRYVGQTEDSLEYAVEGSQAPEMAAHKGYAAGTASSTVSAHDTRVDNLKWTASNQPNTSAPTVAPPSATQKQNGVAGTGSSPVKGGGATSKTPPGGSVHVDNSTTRGGDTIINNNNTTNIYNYSDDRGSAETR
jgi:hypothetical protein